MSRLAEIPEEWQKHSEYSSDLDVPPVPDNGGFCCSLCNWIGTIYDRFNPPFVTFFLVSYINHGLWIGAVLAVKDYYKAYLKLDPGEQAVYMSLLQLPSSLRVVYGLISDNVPLLGAKRKGYAVLMGVIQFLALFSVYSFEYDDPLVVALVLAIAYMAEAFTNVVTDAMMVIQARNDRHFGSQDFVTLMYLFTGVGGTIGCISAGIITQLAHPKWVFFGYSFMGLIVSVFACRLTPGSEAAMAPSEVRTIISTSEESYEFQVRRQRIVQGQRRELLRA